MLRLLLLALSLPGLAAGAVVIPLSRAELAARSDAVVRARVTSQATLRSPTTGRILTRSRLLVLQAYKGPARTEIELDQLGGTLNGATLAVPGDARLDRGEEVVVFLRCRPGEPCSLTGLALGKYAVRAGEGGRRTAWRAAQGLVDTRGRALDDEVVPLEVLERELRSRP
jgi:hypothetical protein